MWIQVVMMSHFPVVIGVAVSVPHVFFFGREIVFIAHGWTAAFNTLAFRHVSIIAQGEIKLTSMQITLQPKAAVLAFTPGLHGEPPPNRTREKRDRQENKLKLSSNK